MKTRNLLITMAIAVSFSAISLLPSFSQHAIRMPDPFAQLTPLEKKELSDQAAGFFKAAEPATAGAAKCTVSIGLGDNRLCYGTIVNIPGNRGPAILTKWSEVKNNHAHLIVRAADEKPFFATVSGVYPEHDLALLRIHTPGVELPAVNLTNPATPEIGSFILLARPDGKVKGFGVVSVKTRSLREGDKAYLGVMMDNATEGRKGVTIRRVMQESAAHKAGLRKGDVIISVNQTRIKGAVEIRHLLQRLTPGSKITLTYMRANKPKRAMVRLGSLAENTTIRRVPRERMEIMQRMGAIPSDVRSNFPSVIQSDMPIEPNDAGAPVTDLDGKLVGIAIARGSRIKTFIIPTETIRKVLATPPLRPNDVLTGRTRRDDPRNPADFTHSEDLPIDEDPIDQVKRLLGEIGNEDSDR